VWSVDVKTVHVSRPGKENFMSSEESKVHVEDLYSQLEELDMTLTVVFLKDGYGAHLDACIKVRLMEHILADITGNQDKKIENPALDLESRP